MKTYGNIAFLSVNPSSECGIATFTNDLVTTIDHSDVISTQIIAISNTENASCNEKVTAEIRKNERKDYVETAKKLNASDIELLVIEHDYDVFGGEEGEYVLDLVNILEIPVVTTFHTVLSEPNSKQRFIINELGKKSDKIITMALNTQLMLQSIYGIEAEKMEVIHHGVPKKPLQARDALKKKLGFEGRQIISTFGFIGPEKGIECGIEAISKVIDGDKSADLKPRDNSDVLYLILGQTQPTLIEEGEAYRDNLEELVDNLAMRKNIRFVNKYLTNEEIIQYLQVSDIYMTPFLEKEQAVSGTLAYAVGYGKAIVSTPYLYAQEMLADGTGLFADFNDSDALANCLKQILQDPFKKSKMERDTAKIGRKMYWDKIAIQYTKVFLNILAPVIVEEVE